MTMPLPDIARCPSLTVMLGPSLVFVNYALQIKIDWGPGRTVDSYGCVCLLGVAPSVSRYGQIAPYGSSNSESAWLLWPCLVMSIVFSQWTGICSENGWKLPWWPLVVIMLSVSDASDSIFVRPLVLASVLFFLSPCFILTLINWDLILVIPARVGPPVLRM